MAEQVQLIVPARGEYARIVRVMAAALGSRLDMSVDDIEDLRMAVEEAFVHAIDGADEQADVTFTFGISERSLDLSVCVGAASGPVDEDTERRASLSAFILDAVCDYHEFVSDEDGTRWLRISKYAKAGDAD